MEFDLILDNIKDIGSLHHLEPRQEKAFYPSVVHIFCILYSVYHQFQLDILSCDM